CLAMSHLNFCVFISRVFGVCFLDVCVLMLIGALRLKRKAERHE
ncbi:DUF423 domain-containing protein, partial [Pantoea agglomerans]